MDKGDRAEENFVAAKGADYYACLYRENGIKGGHIILLNPTTSEYYAATREQALSALRAYPDGLQIGGGVTADNAPEYIEAGASHVIVTSYVFKDGRVNMENLEKVAKAAGKEHLVLDLSCRMREGRYYIVTDRWQKFTDEAVRDDTLDMLSGYCDEFLIHAVDVEGKSQGIETGLVSLLGKWCEKENAIPVTYAGGVHSYEDIDLLYELGKGKINVTIGSALDIFGGSLSFDEIIKKLREL
jgi:phosphoribosylformimino-5-aminoimidazole carboxamide ribotide isomerase